MDIELRKLVEVVHNPGEAQSYQHDKGKPFTPGTRKEFGWKEVTAQNAHMCAVSPSEHYANIEGRVIGNGGIVQIKIETRKLYDEHFSERRNVTEKIRDQFRSDMQKLVIDKAVISVGESYQPDYESVRQALQQ